MNRKNWKDALAEYKSDSLFELHQEGLRLFVLSSDLVLYTNKCRSTQLVKVINGSNILLFPTYLDLDSEENVVEVKSLEDFKNAVHPLTSQVVERVQISRHVFEEMKGFL